MAIGNLLGVSGFLYRAAWSLAGPLAAPLAWGNGKLARAIRGRRGASARMVVWAAAGRDRSRPLVWFHAASVGEGRQAEAVIVRLRSSRPSWQIAYTFGSASAERFAAGLPVDFQGYVPLDTVGETGRALEALEPTALVFSATDVWPELVRQAARRQVRVALISATLAPTSSRRGALARAFLGGAYRALDRVGATDEADARALAALGVDARRIVVTGDTRHDAAHARAGRVDRRSPALRALTGGGDGYQTVVAGSTWPGDERAFLFAHAEVRGARGPRLVIAPHEPTPRHLAALEDRIAHAVGADAVVRRLSDLERETNGAPSDPPPWEICLVDRVGVLADLYAIAAIAYVGGGFHRAGLHSVIEPAALGVPVLFGPRWESSRDARLLIESGGGWSAKNQAQLAAALHHWLSNETARADAGAAARAVVEQGLGAAERSLHLVVDLVEHP
ncbi:MAG: glycosyltransferase N-terminal domain-containing protein [Gemmatimonadota bacterium]